MTGAEAIEYFVDPAEHFSGPFIEAAIAQLAGVVGICVGGFFAFLIVKVALNWARSALKG